MQYTLDGSCSDIRRPWIRFVAGEQVQKGQCLGISCLEGPIDINHIDTLYEYEYVPCQSRCVGFLQVTFDIDCSKLIFLNAYIIPHDVMDFDMVYRQIRQTPTISRVIELRVLDTEANE